MRESLYELLNLQEVDKEIDALIQSQEDYPDEISSLKKELASAKNQLDEKKDRSQELEKNRRALERDLETITADLKKHQDRLYEVKTNKEYDALQHEIESLQSRIEEHETAIIETIESSEDLQTKLDEDKALFKATEKERKSRIKELSTQLNSVEENVKGWEKKRKGLEGKIEQRPLSMYNRIRRVVRGGVAVVQVKKGACGGCFRELAPQRRMEVRRSDQVIRCEACGRMMVWKEEVAA